ncbi:RES superfamily protein [Pedobacter psychrophilus]|uniref:RES superfamily protein n=1 Tax=Pedobacter psychrophilus TaxID=1826909 RepID=A0A179DKT7_9SPHI|nr:RES family NAD+ phosphorylase [Pedobacter psychrophilus]OAQ41726.1 RES superfamily protein [Pedobacter psychrophilus]
MEVFRLTRERYSDSLSGKGSSIKGARWNSVGVELIYTAGNRSLAMAEVAVYLTLATLPSDFMMLTIEIPDSISIKEVYSEELPLNWNLFPHPSATQKFGNEFVNEGKYCVLKIPSVVTKGDFNFLINPYHKDFKIIKISKKEKFPFDKRIFK